MRIPEGSDTLLHFKTNQIIVVTSIFVPQFLSLATLEKLTLNRLDIIANL